MISRHIVICDDEPEVCKCLRAHIEAIGRRIGCHFAVTEFHTAEAMLASMPAHADILLLDIRMETLSGIEAARRLRERNNDVCIIFITNMTQYAMEGYEVHAFGFIRKPPEELRLQRFLAEAVQLQERKRDRELLVRLGGTTKKISLDTVVFVEAFGHRLCMHTTQGELCPAMTLAELDEKLADKDFFRCHKSYLVNFNHVTGFAGDKITMSDGTSIFLSKHRKKEFLSAFARFAGGLR